MGNSQLHLGCIDRQLRGRSNHLPTTLQLSQVSSFSLNKLTHSSTSTRPGPLQTTAASIMPKVVSRNVVTVAPDEVEESDPVSTKHHNLQHHHEQPLTSYLAPAVQEAPPALLPLRRVPARPARSTLGPPSPSPRRRPRPAQLGPAKEDVQTHSTANRRQGKWRPRQARRGL